MQPGNGRPFISQENVRTALERLLYTSSEKTDHPLLFLLLIDQFLANPDLPPLQDAREFALRHILTSVITEALSGLLAASDTPFAADAPLADVLLTLTSNAKTQSPERIGWNWLYCRYVRVDLNLSPETVSQVIHIDERTLRRYQQHAIKRLTDRLTYMEWQARIEQHKRRLRQELRGGAGRFFSGRETLLAHLQSLVKDDFAQKIYLTGAAGVGKTALAEVFLLRLIDDDAIDQIIWIRQPASVAFIRQVVAERLLSETRNISLGEYLLLYRVAVVVDELPPMVDQVNSLAALLAEFSLALVLLISQHFTAIPGVVSLVVPELTQQEAAAFFHRLLEKSAYSDEFQPHFQEIWQQIGGNPLALQLVVQNWRFYGRQTTALPSVEQLFDKLYSHMDERLKLNWMMFVLFPSASVTEDVCLKLWPGKADHEAITVLRQWHMLESAPDSPDTCFLSNAARRYIEEQYRTAHRTHKMIDELVDDLEAYLEDRPAAVYWPLEYLLLSEWFGTDGRRELWVKTLYREGIEQGRWAVWRKLLENTSSVNSDPDIGISYSLCLRRLGEWASAQETLERMVVHTGRAGQFLAQARAMLELAILLRGTGEYEKATAFLSRSEETAARHQDDKLRNQVKIEQAQTALDVGDLRAAMQLLMALPASKRTLSLLGEVYLAGGELERSRTIIQRVLTEYTHTPGEKARLFTLLGRVFEKQGDLQQAKAYFSSALTLLETQYEPFALARAQANMGALMIQEQSWEEARQLLTQAEAAQTKLNDRVALQMTLHNLRLVRAHFAG